MKIGVEIVEDLDALFADDKLKQKCTDGMSKVDGIAFVTAYYKGKAESRSAQKTSSVSATPTVAERNNKRKRKISGGLLTSAVLLVY